MPFGYNGNILRVDLSSRDIQIEKPPETHYRRYLGGSALSAYYLLREITSGVDPLSPENILMFATSVICGTPCAGMNRYTVAAKSPLTGAYGESEAGGFWGPELKFAGFDAIIFSGRADEPVYLWVHDGEVEIRDARNIWGMPIAESQRAIRQELSDQKVRIALIGPAGERLVRYACVVNELRHVNGRTGMGAVMGSKNLKAVAVRGSQEVRIQNKELAKTTSRWVGANFEKHPGSLHNLGTPRNVLPLNAAGLLPTRNFNMGVFEGAEEISGERMSATILSGRETCYRCPIACKRAVKIDGVESAYGGPEYETIASLGSLCGISDLKAIAKGNEMCQKYGMDTISTGAVIAFSMECFEHGLIRPEQTKGIKLVFGNADAVLSMIRDIVFRDGLGDILADGVVLASATLGAETRKYALHVKGQELPMHDPRGKPGVALAYALSPTGADHLEAPHDPLFSNDNKWLRAVAPLGLLEPVEELDLGPRKVRLFMYLQQMFNLYNSLGLCNFVGIPFGPLPLTRLAEYTRAVTGWDIDLWELIKVGERFQTLTRIFNLREGFTHEDDDLPQRMFVPLREGQEGEIRIDREKMLTAIKTYYQMMGWNSNTGVPLKAKLDELDIGWAGVQSA